MSSSIFFKFKSQKEPSQITFDGTSLSVFELKRDIIAYNKLGDGTDFTLEIYSADTNDVYDDDTVQIPRSTTVIARRIPSKPGQGRAARYVSGKMPVTAKNQHRIENMQPNAATTTAKTTTATQAMTEEEKLMAIMNENTAILQEQSADIAAKGVNNRPFFPKNTAAPDKPVPDGYICHRCGQKGHWIQACPTNDDPNFDGRPKFRRTTGIPRSFLKAVDKEQYVDADGKVDVSKLPAGVMYTPEGELVTSNPDEASWQRFQDKTKTTAEQQKAAEDELAEIRDRGLECPLNHALFVDPVRTPCCDSLYCRACVENELIEKDFACPNCGSQVLLDDLKADEEIAKKVVAYKEERDARRTEEALSKAEAGSPASAATPRSANGEARAKSPSPSTSNKRAAEEELENDRKPEAPAMQKSDSKSGTAVQPAAQPQNDFMAQMNQMMGSMAGAQNGLPAFANPMMMNPMMMNQMNQMMMNQMMMNQMMPNMTGMPFNNNFVNGNNFNNGAGGPPTGPRGWQNQGYNMQNNGNGGAYMRQPVNGHRHRGRQNRPGSTDYKQL